MDVSRETPDVKTKPKCYDLTDLLVRTWLYLATGRSLTGVLVCWSYLLLQMPVVWKSTEEMGAL